WETTRQKQRCGADAATGAARPASSAVGVIALFPKPYAASCLFCGPLAVSRWTTGIGLDAKYLRWTSCQTRLNLITRRSKITWPPAIVHDIPERLSRCVNTILQAASVMPEPRGKR